MDLGAWSRPMGWLATCWLFGTSLLLFLPYSSPVTLTNMNWLCAPFAAACACAAGNWEFNSKHHFKGPKRVDGRVNSVVAAGSRGL